MPSAPNNNDAAAKIAEIKAAIAVQNEQLVAMQQHLKQLNTAFIRNDLGVEDFDGHRKDHLQRKASSDALATITVGAAQKVVYSIVGGLLAFAGVLLKAFFWGSP